MPFDEKLKETLSRVAHGGDAKYHHKNAERGKLFARERITRLVDEASFVEDAMLARVVDRDLPADGVVTGTAAIAGRAVAIMANDSTVKAGSWGRLTVEKILRVQETALRLRVPMLYLVDSAGARITEQAHMFPGRRGAGRIFYNQVQMSGQVPQVCLLFGPSAAGGAYIPAFCDVVAMVEGSASMYLGSPRMAEMVIGEKATLEEMGGAKMHCTVSGCGDVLCDSEEQAIDFARRYLGSMPSNFEATTPAAEPRAPRAGSARIEDIVPADENKPFDMMAIVHAIVDDGSWLEIKSLFAREVLTGL